jgi:7-carboxy-7-deazaguanine synthase
VCTGGEPLLQLDRAAIDALHDAGFEIGVETNGTLEAPNCIDWLCVSPKGTAKVVQTTGDELKLVYPQVEREAQPDAFIAMQFKVFSLQPLDNDERVSNTERAVRFCLEYPQWRLSLQTHKILGID